MFKFLYVFLSMNIIGLTAIGQIVNIEKKRKKTDGLQTTIGFNFNVKESSSQILELKNNIDLQYSKKSSTIIFLNNIKLLSVDKGSLINNGFQHLRYNYTLRDSSFITLEAFGQHQYNEQKLLRKRFLAGLGPRFRILNSENFKWYFAPLSMYEYENLNDSISTEIEVIRMSAYTNVFADINGFMAFNFIGYFQPDYNNFSDYRISGETGIRFKVNKYLSFDVNYALDFDNDPPENVQNTFWYLRNRLLITF